jgi:DHA2 family multidrug resistance protein
MDDLSPVPAESVNKWLVTLAVMSGAIMSALDTSIVNVALPYMRGNLGATVDEITWVATGYILSNVIVMPIIALLSSRFGRKRFLIFSVLLFTLSSMLCGAAWSLTSMVVFRVLQGIGGGVLIPVSQAILRETFPPEEQGMAMGIFGLGVVLGPAFGPTLGGWLTDNFSWPWIFYINVPVGIVNLLLVSRYIHDPPYLTRNRGRIDVLGLGLMITGLGALQLMLEKGEEKDWFSSRFIIALAIVAVLGLLLFVWRELSVKNPAVDLRLLKNFPFAMATLIGGAYGAGLFACLFLVPMFLQNLLGYPALDSGLALMPRSVAMALTMPLAGRLYNRFGPRLLVGSGLLINVYSFWELSRLTLGAGFMDIFFPQLWQGIGFGIIFVALSTAALSCVDKPQVTAASGLYNVIRQVAGSVGIAASATMLTRGETTYHGILTTHLTPANDAVGNWLSVVQGGLHAAGVQGQRAAAMALRLLDGETTRQASMLAYNHVFLYLTALFLVCVPLIFLLRAEHRAPTEPVTGE